MPALEIPPEVHSALLELNHLSTIVSAGIGCVLLKQLFTLIENESVQLDSRATATYYYGLHKQDSPAYKTRDSIKAFEQKNGFTQKPSNK